MKIKVTPEGRPEIFIPDRESLKKWIRSKKFKVIHNFIASGSMVIGADHGVPSVLKDIDMAERCAILIGAAAKNNIGHCLALVNDKLEMYDIGQVTLEDLVITK